MTTKKLAILGTVAAAMLALTVWLYRDRPAAPVARGPGAYLIPGLSPEDISRIEIARGDLTVTLERDGDVFQIKERGNYPASTAAVFKLIAGSMDIRIKEKVADSASYHASLGVAPDSAECVTVKFMGKNGAMLAGLALGKDAELGRGAYARLLDEEQTYVTEEALRIHLRPMDYVETRVVEFPADDIQRVTVQQAGGSYVIERDGNNQALLKDMPAGKQPKKTGVLFQHDLVFGILPRTDIFEISAEKPSAGRQWDTTYVAELKSGAKYTIQLSHKEKGENFLAHFSATPPAAETIKAALRAAPGHQETAETLKARQEVISAAEKAERFNQLHGGWIYEVSELDGRTISKPFLALIEDAPAPEGPVEEIAARHILIAYEGAERSQATRTKPAANELCIKVLMEARRPGSDFAKLAEKYSDCPSKEKGGDLGTFKRGTMAKAFEEAAFGLKVGQLSGIVETPFGFHVIQRTR